MGSLLHRNTPQTPNARIRWVGEPGFARAFALSSAELMLSKNRAE